MQKRGETVSQALSQHQWKLTSENSTVLAPGTVQSLITEQRWVYRLRKNAALSASLEAEFEKEAARAVLYSIIAALLTVVSGQDNKISIAGIALDLKEQFFLSGAFCALSIFFGASAFLTGIKLQGAGWPSTYLLFYKRYVFKSRNKQGKGYRPRRTKNFARTICYLFNCVLVVVGIPVLLVYIYGVVTTFPDLMRIIYLLCAKVIEI
ncbi:hypothetical protein O9X90_07670 [Agrobacterium leguminum]|uniref:hypothetical protein n=1 Tax=Agrobacterium leguminum TaxID=2792015 RepID=UPI0022B82EC0|nr:hypothetical protein [Agrobacterium leguminum]MCZ7932187.1 hypothetical protein [Agrobacterium leguminum]